MIRIRLGRDTNSKASGMSAKQWEEHLKARVSQGVWRDFEIAIKREVNCSIRAHLLKMEQKRQEAMRNWTKQP